jgi:3-oxoacyl-[acyl-carrier protein] reductase
MTTLEGKTAIVTGGSRGIGLATAATLVADGASVAISGTNESRLEEACATLVGSSSRPSARVLTVRADVREAADASLLVERTVAEFGGLDILVNNAGVGEFVEVASMTPEQWHRVIETNLTGVFYCCRAAIPHLKRRGGWIINVSSLAGDNPFAGGAAYCASKAGLNAFSEALMHEIRHDGIRVTVVAPGSVRTGFSRGGENAGADWKLAAEDVARVIRDLTGHPDRSFPSRVDLRPARPPRK